MLLTCRSRSGAYKAISAEAKYGRTTENAYKDTNTYGKKESTMSTVYEVSLDLLGFKSLSNQKNRYLSLNSAWIRATVVYPMRVDRPCLNFVTNAASVI